jgi:hypothetical protein
LDGRQLQLCKAGQFDLDQPPLEFVIGGLILAGMFRRKQLLIHHVHKRLEIGNGLI